MPGRPPRPLCLPELVSNPQTRADFVLANPPRYGSSLSHSSLYSDSGYPRAPPSPTSTNDADSHRASGATLASLTSPVTAASSRTSLSVHNLSSHGDAANSIGIGDGHLSMPGTTGTGSERQSWVFGRLSLGGVSVTSPKPRASWSAAFVTTKSWFGGSGSSESAETAPSASSKKEIKLSPSMIAASVSAQSMPSRPVSSPYPSSSDAPVVSSAGSVGATTRSPKVGTGLRYYTERNPAPVDARVQIPDPIDIQDSGSPEFSRRPPDEQLGETTSIVSAFSNFEKELPLVPDVTVCTPTPTLHQTALKDFDLLRGENTGPLSPPPTPPVLERESNVPRIRISSGDDL